MSDMKDRDFDIILSGCKSLDEAIKNVRSAAVTLKFSADTAENTLKDDAAKKSIDAVRFLAEVILKTTKQGEDQVQELQHKTQRDKADWDVMCQK